MLCRHELCTDRPKVHVDVVSCLAACPRSHPHYQKTLHCFVPCTEQMSNLTTCLYCPCAVKEYSYRSLSLFLACLWPSVAHSSSPDPLPGPPTHPQAPPLTLENLQPQLQRVQDHWGLISWLRVPDSKLEEIRNQFGSDENGAVSACIQWWLQHATSVSWREIVHNLDRIGETGVADTIRQYLEPPTGTVLHVVCRCRNDSCAGELSK